MSNPERNSLEMLESDSVESLCTRTTRIRCPIKWDRKIYRFLIIMIVILSILALGLVIYRVTHYGEYSDNDPKLTNEHTDDTIRKNTGIFMELMLNGTCHTIDCIIASTQFKNTMNSSVDPCNDFYEFACGNSVPHKNPFIVDAIKLNIKLKTMIQNPTDVDDSKAFELMKQLYKSCMNRLEIEAIGLKQFNEIVRKIGGWPLVEGEYWNERAFDWIETTRKLRDIGLSAMYLFTTGVGRNFKNSSIQSLMIGQPEFKLPRNILLNYREPMLQTYYKSAIELAGVCGAHLNNSTRDEIAHLLDFEYLLANISLPPEELRDFDARLNPFKLSELEIKYPYIRWMDYFNAIMPTDMNITPDEVVIVNTPEYFNRLAEVLQKTPKRTIANYIVWRLLLESSQFLNGAVWDRTKDFVSLTNNEKTKQPIRWAHCLTITTSALSPAVGAYVQKFTNEGLKKHGQQFVERIRSSFIDLLNTATWMDENTKKAAMDKAKSTTAQIDFFKELSNKTKLEHFYKGLALSENEFFMNILRLNKFEEEYVFRQLYEPADTTDWLMFAKPATMAVFNIIQANQIVIPAATFQGTLFSDKRPNYMNYGAIGQIIGHEIAHGLDDVGRQFDLHGNLKDWWLSETKLKFLDKAKCVIEQYGNFTIPNTELKVNGKLTQGENIADIVGLKSAYFAYTKWLQSNDDKPLPGFKEYTPKQMFWISSAQIWCSQLSDDANSLKLSTSDVHSNHRFRVLGPMRNSKEFATDFKCAPGTPMNPAEKCEIW